MVNSSMEREEEGRGNLSEGDTKTVGFSSYCGIIPKSYSSSRTCDEQGPGHLLWRAGKSFIPGEACGQGVGLGGFRDHEAWEAHL